MDAQKWISIGGRNAFNPKLWYMGKIPFENELFKEAAKDIKSALLSLTGNTKKLIILDLDDTLWGGIVGDVGIGHLNLGGHDHIGEAYADFQRALKSLINRGILLGLVSKNEEPVALEAIKKHPEMILKLDDFAGWRINWGDKAQNIADLVSELNLGLDSVVFIDDSPLERARVREALPEVYVPEWPVDKMLYRSTLLSLPCFDTVSITKEDLERSKSYAAERMRKNERLSIPSSEDWLKALKIKVVCEELNENNIQRTAQLLNKTNQMNLSTRRMREAEFKQWAAYSLHKVIVFRVSDKFGHLGLTGIISAQIKDKEAKVIDFILSCRAFGRKIEETMLYVLCRYAKKNKLKRVYMEYIPTKKNKPCLEFLENSCFSNKAENVFVWDLKKEYKPVPFVKLIAIAVKS